jgi:hypothetical protein
MAMFHTRRIRIVATILSLSSACALPAQAQSLRGLLPGLIAGAALAAAARQGHAQPSFVAVPQRTLLPEVEEEEIEVIAPRPRAATERSVPARAAAERTVPARQKPIAAPAALRPVPVRQPAAPAPTAAFESCNASLTTVSRRHGAVRVAARPAGPTSRDGDGTLVVPLNAVVEYPGKPTNQVQRARVRCRVSTSGEVVALR